MAGETTSDIPVLSEIADPLQTARRSSDSAQFREQLEAHLTAVIHEHADELVHTACREMEALLVELVSDRLKAELPGVIARVIAEHFPGPSLTN